MARRSGPEATAGRARAITLERAASGWTGEDAPAGGPAAVPAASAATDATEARSAPTPGRGRRPPVRTLPVPPTATRT